MFSKSQTDVFEEQVQSLSKQIHFTKRMIIKCRKYKRTIVFFINALEWSHFEYKLKSLSMHFQFDLTLIRNAHKTHTHLAMFNFYNVHKSRVRCKLSYIFTKKTNNLNKNQQRNKMILITINHANKQPKSVQPFCKPNTISSKTKISRTDIHLLIMTIGVFNIIQNKIKIGVAV